MNPERWKEIEALFLEALERPTEEREAFVETRTADDEELGTEVKRMLGFVDPQPGFLAPPTPAAEELPADIGVKSLGDFELLAEIGRGGMGVVFRAWQRSLGRLVAIKVLPPTLTLTSRQVDRFYREARAAAKLDHPNIASVITVGRERQTYFFAMDFVDGHDLAVELEHLRTEVKGEDEDSKDTAALPSSRAHNYFRAVARLMRDAADALHYAHENGIVHRDVKPSNLLLGKDSSIKLVDFGLARDEGQGSITRTGDLAGTPHYMSPEQARARRATVDHRTDVYSLGVVLYELLTLRKPFTGDSSHEILIKIVNEMAPRIRRANGRVPRDLETICNTAMAKDVRDRYPTSAALRDDLTRFLNHEAIVARPPALPLRVARFVRRRRVPVLVGAVAVAMLFGGWFAKAALDRRASERSTLAYLEEAAGAGPIAEWPAGKQLEVLSRLRAVRAAGVVRASAADDVAARLEEAFRDWKAQLVARGERDLASSRDEARTAPERETLRISGLRALSHAAELYPADAELQERARAESTYPLLSVRALDASGAPTAALVSLREIDPREGTVGPEQALGPAPLEDYPLFPGQYRVVVEFPDGAFQEIVTSAGLSDLEPTVVATSPRVAPEADDMILIRCDEYTFPEERDDFGIRGKTLLIGDFWIDRTEVTNAEYRAFAAATGHRLPRHWDEEPDLDVFLAAYGEHPVTGVDWLDALAYAHWLGKRLPTLAEMHRVSGGPDNWPFPYSADPEAAPRGNVLAREDDDVRSRPEKERNWYGYKRFAQPVGSHPEAATPEGVEDIWGNVWELTETIVAIRVGPDKPVVPRQHDRWVFGGPWSAVDTDPSPRALWQTGFGHPMQRYENVGFRCAKSVRR